MGSFSFSSTSHVPREEPVAEVLVFHVLCRNEAKILPCMGGDHGSEGAESVSSDQTDKWSDGTSLRQHSEER